MSISVELTPDELAQLQQFTQLPIAAEAVSKAAREYLRLRRLRELKTVSGKVEWQEWEGPERTAEGFPS